MTRIRPWRLIRSRIVFDEPWYRLRRDWACLPDGRLIDDYYVSLRPEVALVFAITPDMEVVMVRQYKHGAGKVLIEFPGGTFRADAESPEQAAARELMEETGYSSAQWESLGSYWDDPTRQDNRLHFFLAREARLAGLQSLDEHEDIEVIKVPLTKLRAHCLDGTIAVSGSVALALLGLEALRR